MSFYYYKNRNKVRLSHIKANTNIESFYTKNEYSDRYFVGSRSNIEKFEINFGEIVSTNEDQFSITYEREFSSTPIVLAIPEEDDINLTITTSTTEATIFSSEIFTGKVLWIALNSGVADQSKVQMIIDTRSVSFTSNDSYKKIDFTPMRIHDFKTMHQLYGSRPIVLVNTDDDINLFVTDIKTDSFIINSSDNFSGVTNITYFAFALRNI